MRKNEINFYLLKVYVFNFFICKSLWIISSIVFVSIGLLYEDKSCLPKTWLPKCTNWMRNEVSSSKPMPPENVAIAIGWPLNKLLKSSPEIESHAMKLERMGGIDPLYSGAQITHFSILKSFFFNSSISFGIFSLLWILGLNNGISRVVRSKISNLF